MLFPFQVSATVAQPPCKSLKKPSAPVSAEHLISIATSYLQKKDEFFNMAKVYAAKMKKIFIRPTYFCIWKTSCISSFMFLIILCFV